MDIFSIDNRKIGEAEKTYVIAEIGINHKGDPELAKEMITQAQAAGADAVKIQTYLTEKRVAKDSPIFSILKACELSFDQQKTLFYFAREKGITLFSTPFDDESIDFLDSVNNPCYKVASFDLVNKKLLLNVLSVKKPVILSRGMASRQEMDEAVLLCREAGVPFAMLHCVSAYPVKSLSSLNLRAIKKISEMYHCPAGFSDHTFGIEVAKYAVAAGATIIEKHFTLSRDNGAPDNPVSVDPAELQTMTNDVRRIEQIMGNARFGDVSEESGILQFRRPS